MNSTVAVGAPVTEKTVALLRALANSAARGPSGDNMQPWSLEIDAAGNSISLFLETYRDSSPMNSGQRMSLVACGASLENLLQLAGAQGWQTKLELFSPNLRLTRAQLARLQLLERSSASDSAHTEFVISERTSNRRMYDARPLAEVVHAELNCVQSAHEQISLRWITARTDLTALAELVARADALMFGNASMRSAFLKNVRFDLPVTARADEGLPLGSLELSPLNRAALRLLPHVPHWLFACLRGAHALAQHSRRLLRSSSGVCIVAVRGSLQHAEIHTGQSTQRAWLALTELGLAAQPMMSLLVLQNALRHGTPELVESLSRRGAPGLLREFSSFLASLGIHGDTGFLLRFGYAPAPSARTGRRGEHP